MGWLALALIGAAALSALWVLGVSRTLWSVVGAALMLGAIGYALQGRPLLAGHPVAQGADPIDVDTGMIALRDSMLGRFTGDGAYLIASDAMMRSGDAKDGVAVILGGIARYPQSVTLWTGLGTALTMHDNDVSPAAMFAFTHAARLSPSQPAPPFFLGLAHVRAGEFAAARPYWARALILSPVTRSYRRDIAVRLARLDRLLAVLDAQPQQ